MKRLINLCIAAAALAGIAGCAQIKPPPAQTKAMPTGLRFDQVGRVSLYAGEPCAPQIMFAFRGVGSSVALAAPRNQSDILTDAANKNQRVRVSGRWRHGKQPNCSYVEVTNAELAR